MRALVVAARRFVFFASVLFVVSAFLVALANLSGVMDSVLHRDATIEARASCQDDELCPYLPITEQEQWIDRKQEETLQQIELEPIGARVLRQTWEYGTFEWGDALYLETGSGSPRVTDLILERVHWTVALFLSGTVLAAYIGIRLGLRMASRALRAKDRALTVVSLVTIVVPSWIWAILFIFLFAFAFRLFPAGGLASVPAPQDPAIQMMDFLWHLVLPVGAFTFSSFGAWAYVTRNLALDAMTEDFVVIARTRGVPEKAVLEGHVFRAASPPIVTTLALALIASWTGSVVFEGVFNWPGIGRLYWEALGLYLDTEVGPIDTPVLIVLPIVYAILFIFTMAVLEVIYDRLDPRIRLAKDMDAKRHRKA